MDFEQLGITKKDILNTIYQAIYDAIRFADAELVECGPYGGYGIAGAVKVAVLASMPDHKEIIDAITEGVRV